MQGSFLKMDFPFSQSLSLLSLCLSGRTGQEKGQGLRKDRQADHLSVSPFLDVWPNLLQAVRLS